LTSKNSNKIAHFLTTKVKFSAGIDDAAAGFRNEKGVEMVF